MKKPCLECGTTFSGRSDKKYCSDDCRSRYHHKLTPAATNRIRSINRVLKKNWKILTELYASGVKKVDRETLLMAGFSFQFCTNIITPSNGKVKKFCYDIGYVDHRNWISIFPIKEKVGMFI